MRARVGELIVARLDSASFIDEAVDFIGHRAEDCLGRADCAIPVRIINGGEAELRVGPAWLGHGLGIEPHLTLTVLGGVEFRL